MSNNVKKDIESYRRECLRRYEFYLGNDAKYRLTMYKLTKFDEEK